MLLIISVSVLLASIAVAGVAAQEDNNFGGGEFEGGESHCALGGVGFFLLSATLGAGFLVSGRFGRIANFKPLPTHKIVVIVMAAYLTGEFIYGSLVRNILFINSIHGILGFSVAALAWLTASLNPLFLRKSIKWKISSKIHLVLAVSLFTLLIVHLAYAFSVLE
jgi:hypothetical protein